MSNQKPSGSGSTRLPSYAMVAGAMGAGFAGISVTYGQATPHKPVGVRGAPMNPQEQELIFARVDNKVAELRTDIRLNTQGLADLKERFGDLSGKMASVPADIAAMKRDIAHLPTKDELGTKLRNWLALAVAVIGMMIAAATFVIKTLPVVSAAS